MSVDPNPSAFHEATAQMELPRTRIPCHRARLRQRFMNSGASSLEDLELLELVLFRASERRNTKQLARRLIEHFGDFNHVISASSAQLLQISGVGDAVVRELKLVEAAAHRLARARVIGRPALSSWSELMTYCKFRWLIRIRSNSDSFSWIGGMC